MRINHGPLVAIATTVLLLGAAPGHVVCLHADGAHPVKEASRLERSRLPDRETVEVQKVSRLKAIFEVGERTQTPIGIDCVVPRIMEARVVLPAADKPVRPSLDAILSGAPGYSWHMEGRVAEISCRAARSMRGSPLDVVLPLFSIQKCSIAEANHYLLLALYARLHPGVGIAGEYNPGRSKATVGPMRLRNVSVRAVLNRIVASGPMGIWYDLAPPTQTEPGDALATWGIVAYDDADFSQIPTRIQQQLDRYR